MQEELKEIENFLSSDSTLTTSLETTEMTNLDCEVKSESGNSASYETDTEVETEIDYLTDQCPTTDED